MLDNGTSSIAVYAVYGRDGAPLRVLVYNSEYYTTGTRPSATVSLSGLSEAVGIKRFTSNAATSLTSDANHGGIAIGTSGGFDAACDPSGTQGVESVTVQSGTVTVSIGASEAFILYL